jgi:D-glycero-alpha-D-manno-heptose-7-phosphate kinase
MLLARAPLRISFMGGGSDLPSFSNKEFGQVISCTINKYIYLVINQPFDQRIRLSYSKTEIVDSPKEIKHPLFRETLIEIGPESNLEIGSFADVPDTGTGLGSSSSFTVALVAGLKKFQNLSILPDEIAALACKIELDRCGDPIGKQDQYASAIGGFNKYCFNMDGSVSIDKDILSQESLLNFQNSLYLIYLGFSRKSNEILLRQSDLLNSNNEVFEKTRQIRDLVDHMILAIKSMDMQLVGEMLEDSWQIKKQLSEGISNVQIDECFQLLKSWGASGGKLLGAGGGGFLLMVVPSKNQINFEAKLEKSHLRRVKFTFENSGVETFEH